MVGSGSSSEDHIYFHWISNHLVREFVVWGGVSSFYGVNKVRSHISVPEGWFIYSFTVGSVRISYRIDSVYSTLGCQLKIIFSLSAVSR